LQEDCPFIEEERRIKKAVKATIAITVNRMVILRLMVLVSWKDEDKRKMLQELLSFDVLLTFSRYHHASFQTIFAF
jgi:hypothetical protein